jgi:predicted HD superfamily hydrolase involved in NAD metabolism
MFCNKDKIHINDFEGLRKLIKSQMKEKRYAHTLGVEREAEIIAKIYNCGEDVIKKLKAAAILHDITKEFEIEKQLEVCKSYNIKLSGDDLKAEKSIHAKTGAYIAKIEFGADKTIFDGIYNHTVLRPSRAFSLFERIIYLADWTEPGRDYDDCAAVREYFYSKINSAETIAEKNRALDETILFSCNKSIQALIQDNLFIHKDTIECRNALVKKKITV